MASFYNQVMCLIVFGLDVYIECRSITDVNNMSSRLALLRQPTLLVSLGRLQSKSIRPVADGDSKGDPQLRQCQEDCLEACAKGARVIEMACGTGKTRVIKELVEHVSGKVTGT